MVGMKSISLNHWTSLAVHQSVIVSSVVVLSCCCIVVLVYCWMYIPDLPTYLVVVVLLCCRMYIPDLPTYLVFYLETTRGSSIDPPLPPPMTTTRTTTATHFKSFYIPDTPFLCSENYHRPGFKK